MAGMGRPNNPDTNDKHGGTGFHQRYSTDAEFRKRIDRRNLRAEQQRSLNEINEALDMVRKGKKHY